MSRSDRAYYGTAALPSPAMEADATHPNWSWDGRGAYRDPGPRPGKPLARPGVPPRASWTCEGCPTKTTCVRRNCCGAAPDPAAGAGGVNKPESREPTGAAETNPAPRDDQRQLTLF